MFNIGDRVAWKNHEGTIVKKNRLLLGLDLDNGETIICWMSDVEHLI